MKSEISSLLIEAEGDYIRQIVRLQSQTSGLFAVDMLKHLIRPVIALIMIARMVSEWFGAPPLSPDEWLVLKGVVGFYFVSRGVEKVIKKIV
jgi:hypothetical protein|tara:strand:+ start:1490 stop:1765 length:276 start_codon:yes stop_codon:yes gene_type:complete